MIGFNLKFRKFDTYKKLQWWEAINEKKNIAAGILQQNIT